MFGGYGEDNKILGDCFEFNVDRGVWRKVQLARSNGGIEPSGRYLHAACAIRDTIYLYGGNTNDFPRLSSKKSARSLQDSDELFAFETGTGRWREIKAGGRGRPSARHGHAMTSWRGNLVLCGGNTNSKSPSYLKDCYSFDVKTQRWDRMPDLPMGIAYHSVFAIGDELYLFGGHSGSRFIGELHKYDPSSRRWSVVSARGTRPSKRSGCTVQTVGDCAYVFGGYSDGTQDNEIYRFDQRHNRWMRVALRGSKPVKRAYLQSAFCRGYFYIFGGYNGNRCISDMQRVRLCGKLSPAFATLPLDRAVAEVISKFGIRGSGKVGSASELRWFVSSVQRRIRDAGAQDAGAQGASGSFSAAMDANRLSDKDLKMVDAVVQMGLKKENVVQALQQLKIEASRNGGRRVDQSSLVERIFENGASSDGKGRPPAPVSTPPPAPVSTGTPDRQGTGGSRGGSVFGLDGDDEDPPEDLVCPLTQELLKDPVVLEDGVTYERKAITDWLTRSNISPMTNNTLSSKAMVPNRALRAVIEKWKKAMVGKKKPSGVGSA